MSWCERPTLYEEDFPKARKQYSCCECKAPIDKGETHLKYRMLFDGSWSSERQHMLCREACMHVRQEHEDGECIPFGGLSEWWSYFEGKRCLDEERVQKIRRLMAGIISRERKAKTGSAFI